MKSKIIAGIAFAFRLNSCGVYECARTDKTNGVTDVNMTFPGGPSKSSAK